MPIKTNASLFLAEDTEVRVEKTELGHYIRLGDDDSTFTIHFLRSDPASWKTEAIAGLRQALDHVERELPAMYLVRDQAVPAIELCERHYCHHAKAAHAQPVDDEPDGECADCNCPSFVSADNYDPPDSLPRDAWAGGFADNH